jgi:hypothetical protein
VHSSLGPVDEIAKLHALRPILHAARSTILHALRPMLHALRSTNAPATSHSKLRKIAPRIAQPECLNENSGVKENTQKQKAPLRGAFCWAAKLKLLLNSNFSTIGNILNLNRKACSE